MGVNGMSHKVPNFQQMWLTVKQRAAGAGRQSRILLKKYWWGIFPLAMVAAITAAVVYGYGAYNQITVKPTINPDIQPSEASPPPPDPLRPISILLMGYGGGNHAGGLLTDTMMIARINPREKTIHLISLPRDLWVGLPIERDGGESHWKINAAYAIGSDDDKYLHKPVQYTGEGGGGELAKYAVNKVLGIPIDHFVTLNFYGFERSIDVLGGVNVNVERTFDDFQYPIEGKENETCEKSEEELAAIAATSSAEQAEKLFPCRYEHLHFDRGINLMDGQTALKYVRSRHSAQDGGDFGRAARQRNLIQAVQERIFEVNFLPKAIPFVSTLRQNVQTDIDVTTMQEYISKYSEWKDYTLKSVALTDKNILMHGRSSNGQFIVIPQAGEDQWPAVHDWLMAELTASESGEINL
jgi:polyisoprenyl-teichoic acid--peptidoglycan teichoic acid transferase